MKSLSAFNDFFLPHFHMYAFSMFHDSKNIFNSDSLSNPSHTHTHKFF